MFGRTTYSLSEVTVTISHPSVGQKVISGEGLGSVSWGYTDDQTVSDLGADGSDMVTKVVSHRGTVSIELQQTFSTNAWLRNYANAMDNGSSSIWGQGSISIKENFSNGAVVRASNVSLVKRPDHKDGINGDRMTWAFHAANITES